MYHALKRKKVSFTYESAKIPYVLARHYIPDFVVQTPQGRIYIECKGHFRREDKAKLKAVKKQHPEIDLRILFYASVPSSIRWAVKEGFKYSVGQTVPKEWLNGL